METATRGSKAAPPGKEHWTVGFLRKLAEHKTVGATLKATGISAPRLYKRMAKDPAFRAAVEGARTVPKLNNLMLAKRLGVEDLV